MKKIKKNLSVLVFIIMTMGLYSQNRQEYYVRVKQNQSIEPIVKIINSDGSLSLTFNNSSLSSFFNNKYVTKYERAFLDSQSSLLKRTYIITLENDSYINELSNIGEVEFVELVPTLVPLYEPNDYAENIESSSQQYPNRNLELIHAQEAFDLTHGDENIIVGVVDTEFQTTHEELSNKIIENFDNPCTSQCWHGTIVAGQVAGETDNGVGIASIGFNTKLVTYQGIGTSNMTTLALYPGVRILNASWGSCSYSATNAEAYREIWEDFGVVVVAGAGNGLYGGTLCPPDGYGYFYPASYDHVISVSSIGHRNNYGTTGGWWPNGSNWKDVHPNIINFEDVDPNGDSFPLGVMHQHNDKVDLVTPGYAIPAISSTTESGYGTAWGTSHASPNVAGACALILAINPSLTPNEVRDILLSTTDATIYDIPENQPYIGLLGTGRLNVYRAVKTAKCLLDNVANPQLDLYLRNSKTDLAVEPDNETEFMWYSNDIWVRNQSDGIYVKEHQNPEYDPNNPNYVYVRVRNTSCATSSGNEQLKLYWSKANTSLAWPQHWDGSLFIEGVSMGDEVATLNIPALEPGQETIIEYEWNVPNPDDYIDINSNPWHFCLLARMVSPNDPMTFTEVSSINSNVKNNNNIIWKNMTVVDILPNINSEIGGVVAVGNPNNAAHTYKLEFVKEQDEQGKAIYEEAEVTIEMDDVLYNAWLAGGESGSNIKATKNVKKKIVTGNNVILDNIQFAPNEIGTLYLTFNFLTKELTDKEEFTYHVIQRDAATNEIIGGETYKVTKVIENTFSASAGNDKQIEINETVTISAEEINGAAIYNWYDDEGNLIYTGKDLTVSPNVTKTYQLEIITDTDGYKDYDEIEVTVNPYSIQSLTPNPASNQVLVNYKAQNASSAYIMITSTANGTSNNYILNTNELDLNIDISSYQQGVYAVALVCNGVIVDAKNLIIE